MNNNVVYRVGKALEEAGTAVLRFNFRGVGRSTGSYGDGIGEEEDARAALDFISARHPNVPLWVAGFSFGARVGLKVGMTDARVARLLGLGLAVKMFDLEFLLGVQKPIAVVQGAMDELGGADQIRALVARLPEPKRLWLVDGATHLFPGKLDEVERATAEAIAWLDGADAAPAT